LIVNTSNLFEKLSIESFLVEKGMGVLTWKTEVCIATGQKIQEFNENHYEAKKWGWVCLENQPVYNDILYCYYREIWKRNIYFIRSGDGSVDFVGVFFNVTAAVRRECAWAVYWKRNVFTIYIIVFLTAL